MSSEHATYVETTCEIKSALREIHTQYGGVPVQVCGTLAHPSNIKRDKPLVSVIEVYSPDDMDAAGVRSLVYDLLNNSREHRLALVPQF